MPVWDDGIQGELTLQLINRNDTTVRVEAGPGTGKTSGLVRRVQRILHPEGLAALGRNVLVVAFNRVIANDLRSEITRVLENSPHDGDPVIRTVHALCLMVIGATPRPLLPHEREAMIYDVLTLFPVVAAQYTAYNEAEQALRDHEANLADHTALWQAVRLWLTRHKAILISELPRLLLDGINAGDFETNRYDHVIVDEFQDLTAGEQALFMKLRKPGGSIVALGDSKQSIYRFRGNDRDGLKKLEQLNEGNAVTDIPMRACYRCPASIVNAANTLMNLYPPPMQPANATAANLHVVYWRTPQAETRGMASHIVANIAAHPSDRHLAMVTRRQFGFWLRDAMKADDQDLAIDLSFSESLLETWPVREAFLYFCLLADPDQPTWRAWFGYKTPGEDGVYKAPRRNAGAYLRLFEAAGDDITFGTVQNLVAEPRTRPRGVGGKNLWDRAERLLQLRQELHIQPGDDASAVLLRIFDQQRWIGSANATAEADFDLVRSKCVSLVDEVRESHPDDAVEVQLREIARHLRYMIATREPFESEGARDLQITTLWGAKGMTAEHVYILGLCDEAIPGKRRPEYPGTDGEYAEEQRRLFYVSLTRSKRTLVLSRATKIHVGMARDLGLSVAANGFWADLRMCSFLRDIMATLPTAVAGTRWAGCGVDRGTADALP